MATDIGCASGTGAAALDAFFAQRLGPVLGLDYQHVYPLGGDRYLWLLQDTFIDQPGVASQLGQASFVHNAALVQRGACFSLYHRGSLTAPASFEQGDGERPLAKWFWPMGGELVNDKLTVFWVEMEKDGYEPGPGDGLGWHPRVTWVATYNSRTLTRTDFRRASVSSVTPIYGYVVASQGEYTYLFGNTFEQNLAREGGWANGPHSGAAMRLARVPLGQFFAEPEFRTSGGWSPHAQDAQPISQRFWAENPMQPRWLGGQWVSATKVDGYWGEQLVVDVAAEPWGPWTTVEQRRLAPRNSDPLMNTYHAHLMPWLDSDGNLVISISQNARDMFRDAWPRPDRYRPQFVRSALVPPRAQPIVTTPITTGSTVPTTASSSTTTTPTSPTPAVPTTASSTTASSTTASSTTASPTTASPTTARPSTTVPLPGTSAPTTTATTTATIATTTATTTITPPSSLSSTTSTSQS